MVKHTHIVRAGGSNCKPPRGRFGGGSVLVIFTPAQTPMEGSRSAGQDWHCVLSSRRTKPSHRSRRRNTLPLNGIQFTGHRSVTVQPAAFGQPRGRDRLLPTGSSARPPLRHVSPAAVPWRLECRHDANTERPRQGTCPRQEGGSAPASRCRRWLRRGRRDGELAPPVRASRLARR